MLFSIYYFVDIGAGFEVRAHEKYGHYFKNINTGEKQWHHPHDAAVESGEANDINKGSEVQYAPTGG